MITQIYSPNIIFKNFLYTKLYFWFYLKLLNWFLRKNSFYCNKKRINKKVKIIFDEFPKMKTLPIHSP